MKRTIGILVVALVVPVSIGGCVDSRYGHRRDGYRPPYDDRDYSYDRDRDDRGAEKIVCASKDGRPNHCRVDFPIARAEVDKRYSKSRCDYGRTWGYDRDGVWVDHGCRARFRVMPVRSWR